jgi:hypothetical protein
MSMGMVPVGISSLGVIGFGKARDAMSAKALPADASERLLRTL